MILYSNFLTEQLRNIDALLFSTSLPLHIHGYLFKTLKMLLHEGIRRARYMLQRSRKETSCKKGVLRVFRLELNAPSNSILLVVALI